MWKPGQSGNPSGQQREKRFLAALERAITQDDGKKLRSAAEKLLDCAVAGESWAIQQLADRLDGKASQQIDVNVKRDTRDYSMEELLANLAALRGSNSARADSAKEGAAVPSEFH